MRDDHSKQLDLTFFHEETRLTVVAQQLIVDGIQI